MAVFILRGKGIAAEAIRFAIILKLGATVNTLATVTVCVLRYLQKDDYLRRLYGVVFL